MMNFPEFDFVCSGEATDIFLLPGLSDFRAAADYVWRLPYGRNTNRADYSLVLQEQRGTCSTKHALLAALAAEQKQKIFLTLGIYEMNARNTPGVGEVLDEFNLESLPEAHCYLTFSGVRIDVTRFSNEETAEPIENFLYEERIRPCHIGDYKLKLHRTCFQSWMRRNGLSKGFDFEELWSIRERCIASLTQ